jgi:hypothetical protein
MQSMPSLVFDGDAPALSKNRINGCIFDWMDHVRSAKRFTADDEVAIRRRLPQAEPVIVGPMDPAWFGAVDGRNEEATNEDEVQIDSPSWRHRSRTRWPTIVVGPNAGVGASRMTCSPPGRH